MNLYKINVKYKVMNLHNKFYILFVHNRRKVTKNMDIRINIESIPRHGHRHLPFRPLRVAHGPGMCGGAVVNSRSEAKSKEHSSPGSVPPARVARSLAWPGSSLWARALPTSPHSRCRAEDEDHRPARL